MASVSDSNFHCKGCGSNVSFDPSQAQLACPYCGTTRVVPQSEKDVVEHDLETALRAGFGQAPETTASTVHCKACGATSVLKEGAFAGRCPFCEAPISTPVSKRVLTPQAILPFSIESQTAKKNFESWLKSRWFAPSDMLRRARKDGLEGVYLPFFGFDAETETFYRGQRGDHYYENETFHVQEDGRRVTKTRQVQKTRWRNRSGVVWVYFDDVLILASTGLSPDIVRPLEPWDLEALVPFNASYTAGFTAECDQLGLDKAFSRFKERCQPNIKSAVRRDIGGDEQRIQGLQSAFTGLTYRHVLLPVWVGAFRYGEKVFRIVVNARTGEVQGERPWSWIKISLAFAAAAIVIGVIWWFLQDAPP